MAQLEPNCKLHLILILIILYMLIIVLLLFFVLRQQRLLTYQVLCSWLAVAGSQSSLEMFSENLISGILLDIKYTKPSLDLIVSILTN